MPDDQEKPAPVPYTPPERTKPAGAAAAGNSSVAAGKTSTGEGPVTESGRAAGTLLTGQPPAAGPTGTAAPGHPAAAGPTDTVPPGQVHAAEPTGTVTTGQDPAVQPSGTAAGASPARPRQDLAVQFLRALRAGWARGISLLASAVMIAAVVIAVIFAVHILFVVFSANPANSIVQFVNRWAQQFAWRFSSLFTPHSQRLAVLADYGIAAIAYLVAGRIVAGVIRRFG